MHRQQHSRPAYRPWPSVTVNQPVTALRTIGNPLPVSTTRIPLMGIAKVYASLLDWIDTEDHLADISGFPISKSVLRSYYRQGKRFLSYMSYAH